MIRYARKKTAVQERLDQFESLFKTKEPRIHSFLPEVERFKRLQRQAAALDAKYRKKVSRPPLYGLTLGVKDIFHVDGFPTLAGSRLPARALRGPEAASVTALKQAGMLVSGKTATTEFAYFAPGLTRNPHNTAHTPGGSSSGSAAAVAAGLVDLALGTQTIGSIVRPASFCGVVGFKPTYGRISAAGVIPLAKSLDHVGLFAQDVSLISKAAAVLCSKWDPTGRPNGKPYIAIPTGDYLARASKPMRAHFDSIVELLEGSGYGILEVDAFGDFAEVIDRHHMILAAEAARAHSAWYESFKFLYHPQTAALIERGFAISDLALSTALQSALNFRNTLSTLMGIHGIHLWLSPASIGAAPKGLTSTGDPVMNLPWTQAGFPVLALPSGFDADGLPLGIQLAAGFGRDEQLLTWGSAIESALGAGL
jgi:Asp-tRNA(Asn)/Glu-tRNA(Gln) amidotransferase A subunit family amidase